MYREVTMIEVREVLRLRGEGLPKKRIAAQLGLDPKTVRRYLAAAQSAGVRATATISDEEVRQVLLGLHPTGGRPRGDGWARCLDQRAAIERWLGDGLRLTKIRELLIRQGVDIAYPTLHRFAVLELQCGKTATTIPVLDGDPGHELQLDTGWVGWLTLPQGKKRRFRAWIFTAVCARATALCIRPSRRRRRARSKRVKPGEAVDRVLCPHRVGEGREPATPMISSSRENRTDLGSSRGSPRTRRSVRDDSARCAGHAGALDGSQRRSSCLFHGRRAPAELFDDR